MMPTRSCIDFAHTRTCMDYQNLWTKHYGSTLPLGYLLRKEHREKWTRFHSLPDSQRYPHGLKDFREIVRRASVIVSRLYNQASDLWLIASYDKEYFNEIGDEPTLFRKYNLKSSGERTGNFIYDDEQTTFIFCSSAFGNKLPNLYRIFLEAAVDREMAILFDQNTGRVFAPYDGGFDLFDPEQEILDNLEREFGGWMSGRPDKL